MALFLVFAIMLVSVQVGFAGTSASAKEATGTSAQPLLFATLHIAGRTSSETLVLLNDNSASTDTPILSGSTIKTSETGASVELSPLGMLQISPRTALALSFDGASINVALSKGEVVLTTAKGVSGTVTTLKGTTKRTDAVKSDSVAVSADNEAVNSSPAPQGSATNKGGLFGLGWPMTIGITGFAAVITTAVLVNPCRRGRNPSPGEPRGRNECND